MDPIKFEYIEFNAETKTEKDLPDILPTIKLETADLESDYNETMCGSVFLSNCKKYAFVCAFCNQRFNEMNNFGNHLESTHFGDNTLKEEFPTCTATLLNAEIKVDIDEDGGDYDSNNDDKESSYSPPNSSASETEEDDDDESIEDREPAVKKKKPDPTSPFFCKLCRRTLQTEKSFTRHQGRHENGTLRYKLKKVRIEKPPKPKPVRPLPAFYCDLCKQSFRSRLKLREHAEQAHGDEIPTQLQSDPFYLSCEFCYQTFSRVLERLEHEKTHTEDRAYRCKFCSRRFIKSRYRNLHVLSHNVEHPIRLALDQMKQQQHTKKSGEYHCHLCGKFYNCSTQLRNHIRLHTNEKPYQCEKCGKSFRIAYQLNNHMKRHEGIKDFSCDCGKSFFTRKALNDHEAMHTSDRPFKCNVCAKAFPRKKALQVHVQLHSDVKRYECNICGKRFAQCAGLHAHRKSNHRNEL